MDASAGRFPSRRLLAASCHDAEELALAASMGVEFVTLSPVQPTESHPGEPALGWDKAAELIAGFNQPVYLLGGVGPQQSRAGLGAWSQGVAGIRAFWPGGLDGGMKKRRLRPPFRLDAEPSLAVSPVLPPPPRESPPRPGAGR